MAAGAELESLHNNYIYVNCAQFSLQSSLPNGD